MALLRGTLYNNKSVPFNHLVRHYSSSLTNGQQIGFIGLGKIGYGMANNICSANNLLVYDIDSTQSTKLKQANTDKISIASSASEVASNTNILISVLPNDKILTDIVDSEIYRHQSPNSIHISCSTISPDTARHLASIHYKHNETQYISSPVFARPDGMKRGESTIPISGGTQSIRDNVVKPILSNTSTAVYDFGDDVAAANVVKICGNFLIASAIESMSESFTLAQKNGVDRVAFKEMMTETILNCLIYKGYGQRVSEFDHVPYEDAHFALELGNKDINLVMDTANKSNVPMPFASVLHDRYLTSMSKKREKLDWSAIALSMAEDAGYDVTRHEQRCKELK